MTPRPRKKGNQDLPENLQPDKQGRVTYYRYKFPNGKRKSLGKDKAHACEVAKMLNEKLARPDVRHAIEKMVGKHAVYSKDNPPIEVLIEEFRANYLPTRKYSERSLNEMRIKLNKYKEIWGGQLIQSFETVQIASFLNSLKVSPYIKHRKLLLDLFSFASHQGYVNDNPVARTLPKSDSQREKQRLRHTEESIQAIYEASPEWMQNAIDIAICSLQRRGDIVDMQRSDVNLKKNTIRVLQGKTELYKDPVYLDIEMGKELRAAVLRCMNSDVPCPLLIHRRPKYQQNRQTTTKKHPFAVTGTYLSQEFAKIRDSLGVYDQLESSQRPSFHDLRAWGIERYEAAGYSGEYINALSGHSSDEMRRMYIEGHKLPEPKRVKAELITRK